MHTVRESRTGIEYLLTFNDFEIFPCMSLHTENKLKNATTRCSSDSRQVDSPYNNNLKNGLWTEWYENGRKMEEGSYINNLRDGLWTEWHENGRKKKEIIFKEDVLAYWDEEGKQTYSI